MTDTSPEETHTSGSPQAKGSRVWDNAAIVKTFDAALRLYDDGDEQVDGNEQVPWMHRPLTVDGTPLPPSVEEMATHGAESGAEAEAMGIKDKTAVHLEGASGKGPSINGVPSSDGFIPPFLPSSSADVPALGEDGELLTQMLLAWYNAGYQTGRYQAFREMKGGSAEEQE